MQYVYVRHTVEDYAKWRPGFDANEPARRAAGSTGVYHLFRDSGNPNEITVILEWDSLDNARRFAQDPALREVMKEAGVMGQPEIRFLERA
ncbi:MAG TPA: hypothetical protein VI755_05630 [Anaerolineales bacterium]|nr:hypothetical protein [Anaerolineales bacterium]